MSALLPDFQVVEVPATWRVLAVGACLLGSGTAGAAVASWLVMTLATVLQHVHGEALAAELQARASQRLRAVGATLAATVALVVVALVTGVAS